MIQLVFILNKGFWPWGVQVCFSRECVKTALLFESKVGGHCPRCITLNMNFDIIMALFELLKYHFLCHRFKFAEVEGWGFS
jgi:hypothetical protein